jgi:hypothetical protein
LEKSTPRQSRDRRRNRHIVHQITERGEQACPQRTDRTQVPVDSLKSSAIRPWNVKPCADPRIEKASASPSL